MTKRKLLYKINTSSFKIKGLKALPTKKQLRIIYIIGSCSFFLFKIKAVFYAYSIFFKKSKLWNWHKFAVKIVKFF